MSNSIDLAINGPVSSLYTPFNQTYEQRIADYEEAMIEAAENLEPWQLEATGLRFQDKPTIEIRKAVKKRLSKVSSFLDSPECRLLIRLKKEKDTFIEGPSVGARKNWLGTIVENTILTEPKEASRAISELNKMDKTNEGSGGQTINISINSVLQRGDLDV